MRARRCVVSGAAAGVLAALSPAAAVCVHAETITFENQPIGRAPSGFQIARTGQGAPAAWSIVDDPSTASGRALEQTSRDRTSYRFPLAIYQAITAADVDVQVRFKPLSGQVDQAGGIVVRLSSPDDYYVVRANALEDNVRFYRVVKDRREQLGTADVTVAPSQWHTLGLRAESDRFTITFNDRPLFTVTDGTFPRAGRIGLWTKADSVTRFDQLTITPLE